MSLVLKNRVKSSTTTTGTGTITLGSATQGYQGFSAIGDGNETYYLIKGTTEWEVGKGTYTSSGTTLSRSIVFSSSNSGSLVDFSAGTKEVLCVFPAAAMSGGIPTSSGSNVPTDGSAWYAVEQSINNSIASGVVFDNNNTKGIVSTFSCYVTSAAFAGGVLAPNGDIHFVPYRSNIGQKVSSQGVVSTYTLRQTSLFPDTEFVGGVLATNGEIHFIPFSSRRGQKVTTTGSVQTYSLVYTTAEAYAGGVMATNGEINFVPYAATVGQKLSTAGVVSTYSLPDISGSNIYYYGGVLAPDGYMHFIPTSGPSGNGANGLKISPAGVASTYSIVNKDSYHGGVVDSNGNIHFIPHSASVGQKVSISGVVSTYSLVYTGTEAYAGGVLAPSGDIHFVPYSATVGQKVSPDGVVSTYSIINTTEGEKHIGGVLGENGRIFFIPFNATAPEMLYINSGDPYGIGVCLSPFFNKL